MAIIMFSIAVNVNILFRCFQSSFTEVAKLFTEFFRDLDVVPTDIVAGLVLLRKHQKLRRKCVVAQVMLGECVFVGFGFWRGT